jgi:hypothetical protein
MCPLVISGRTRVEEYPPFEGKFDVIKIVTDDGYVVHEYEDNPKNYCSGWDGLCGGCDNCITMQWLHGGGCHMEVLNIKGIMAKLLED